MAKFQIIWTPNILPQVVGQRGLYRKRLTGGPWLTAGFVPDNDFVTGINSASIEDLDDNCVYGFKIQNLCAESGPIDNTNGIQENIRFMCLSPEGQLEPEIFATSVIIHQLFDTAVTDINQYQITIPGIGTAISSVVNGDNPETFSGLTPNTDYVAQIRYGAIVNGVQVFDDVNTCLVEFTTASEAEGTFNYKYMWDVATPNGAAMAAGVTGTANNGDDLLVPDGGFNNNIDRLLFIWEPLTQPQKTVYDNGIGNIGAISPLSVWQLVGSLTVSGVAGRLYGTTFATTFTGDLYLRII